MADQSNNFNDALPSKKVKILAVVTQSELGGAQQFLIQLVRNLNEQYRWTIVVGSDGGDELKSLLPLNTRYIVARYLKRNPSINSDLRSLVELRKIIRQEQPDILFLNSSKAGFNGSLAARWPTRIPNVRVIYRIGGWQFNDPIPKWKRLMYRTLEKLSAPWKDDIIVNNKKDLDDAKRFRIIPRYSISLIHNGIDPYLEFMDREQARLRLTSEVAPEGGGAAKLFQKPTIVGTIANFYETKGHTYLIEAAKRLPDTATLLIIGDGYLRPQIEKQITESGLEKKVFLLGKIRNAAQYIPAFDVFVLPSLKEGFPWVVLEAIAARVPVVATKVGAVPEIIEHGVSGLVVPPGDASALASAINQVIADPHLAQEMSLQAHQTLLKNYNLRKMLDQYNALFSTSA